LRKLTNEGEYYEYENQIDHSCFGRGGELHYARLIQYGGGSDEGRYELSAAKPEGT
jgi:hypothetical protein